MAFNSRVSALISLLATNRYGRAKLPSGLLISQFMVFTVWSAASATTTQVDVVAITGDQTPDGSGTLIGAGGGPVINDLGEVAFASYLDTGIPFDGGIFRTDGPALVQIARRNQLAPNGNGRFGGFDSRYPLKLNNAGQVAFSTNLSGTTLGAGGIFRSDGSSVVEVMRLGQTTPDGSSALSSYQPGDEQLDAMGHVAFLANLSGVGGGSGIFHNDGATLVQITRTGQLAPNGVSSFNSFATPALNNDGQIAFIANQAFRGPYSIFRGNGTTLVQAVSSGAPAPDGNGNLNPEPSSSLEINDVGNVAFIASLSNTSAGPNDNSGVFRTEGTSIIQIARRGQSVPDLSDSFSFFYRMALNEAGQVAFRASLASGSRQGIFVGNGASLSQIAVTDQVTPDGNGSFAYFGNPALNQNGQLAFVAAIQSTAGGASDDLGLYFFDNNLGLLQVARKGDSFLGSTIVHLEFADGTGATGRGAGPGSTGLNDGSNPKLAYRFHLADERSGVAIWSVVPEPSTASLVAVVLMGVIVTRRKCAIRSR